MAYFATNNDVFSKIAGDFAYIRDLYCDDSLSMASELTSAFHIDMAHTTTLNLGSIDNPKEIQIGPNLNDNEKAKLESVLGRYKEIFALSYEDMPGVDRDMVEHHIPIYPDSKPVRQKFHKMTPGWAEKITEEVKKQLEARFIEVAHYPEWVANIVPVPKKDGRVRMCVDFRDLNKACPKDNFPLPHIDVLVDNVAGSSLFSAVDGYAGYNQIFMADDDKLKTTFVTEFGTFCYHVMPFGLKNAGATYQRMVNEVFKTSLDKNMKVYVDDMMVKSMSMA